MATNLAENVGLENFPEPTLPEDLD